MNIFLMGYRGCGKSTIGPVLAKAQSEHYHFACRFVDLDDQTPRVLGKQSVQQAWRELGEPAFREGESRALAECLEHDGQVVALGGGTPLAPGAFGMLLDKQSAGQAHVVYLRASAALLQARLRADPNLQLRPSLTGLDPVAEAPIVLEQREPIYIKLANVIVSVDGRTPQEVAAEIMRRTR